MGKRIDLTGQVFGEWTVLKLDTSNMSSHNCAMWICQCSCGTIKSVSSQSLRGGKSKSCGCKKIKDLTGQVYGYLEVLKRDDSRKERSSYWICLCHGCGREVSLESRTLQYHLKSCGCKQYDTISEAQSFHLEGQKFGFLKAIERDYSKPRGHDAYWICYCERCGRNCSIRATDLVKKKTRSCGCANSNGEIILLEILKKMNINVIPQYSFDDLYGDNKKLRFDFYLPDYNALIEYQGGQHYKAVELFGGDEKFEQQQRYDNLKREYCKEHNYKLIEIPYWDLNILNENYISMILEEGQNA